MNRYLLICIWLACLSLLSATACSRVQMRPGPDVQLGLTPEIDENYTLDAQWWKIYNDPQLNALMELALANNLDLAQSAINVNRALYQANLIGADLLPAFSSSLDGSARRNLRHGGTGTSVRSVGGDVSVSYELDLWRKLANTADAAQWEYAATLYDLEAARLALINNVAAAYFYLAYLNQAIAITTDSLENYQRIEQIISTKYSLGKVDALEQAQARQSVLSAENNLLNLQAQAKDAEETLRNLLNLRPGERKPGVSQERANYPVPPLPYNFPDLLQVQSPGVEMGVPLAVLAHRPDLAAAHNRLRSAFEDVQAANKSWLPQISLGAGLSSASARPGSAFDAPLASGLIKISLPFLDWNRVYWQVKISEAEFENRVLQFEQAITTALNEVDKFYYRYLNAAKTLEAIQARYDYELKITEYYEIRYASGASELSDWLGALNTQTQSRLELLNARYTQLESENALYRAMAGRYTAKLQPAP